MKNEQMARELIRVAKMLARSRKADSGDVAVYFNVGDYFETIEGGRMNLSQQRDAQRILEDAIYNETVLQEFDHMVWQILRKKEKQIAKIGFRLKG